MAEFPAIDAAIVGLYVVVIFIVGFLASRNIRDTDDFFLAGRGLGFAVIGFSLFASNISGTTLIGLSGQAYAAGISVANYEWMAGLIFLVMAFITVPIFYRNRLSTIPEYFEKRFDPRVRRYISAMTIFLSIFVDTAGSIYAGALILQVFVPGLPFWPTCLGLALFAGLYTVAGGLRAVVYTDVIQAVVLLGGATALTLIIFADTGWSWQAATGGLPEGHLSLIRPLDDPHLPWLGTLNAASTLVFYDFLGERRREKMGMAGALRFGRLLTLGFMVVAALWAPMIRNFPGIFAYLQEIFSYAVPPVVAIFVIGLFWRGATPRAALATLVFGHALGLCALIATQAGWLTLHFTITAGITTGLCALVCLAVSLAAPEKAAPDRAGVIWHRGLVAPDGPHAWYADYRVQVIGVALLTLAIVAAFW